MSVWNWSDGWELDALSRPDPAAWEGVAMWDPDAAVTADDWHLGCFCDCECWFAEKWRQWGCAVGERCVSQLKWVFVLLLRAEP